MCQNSKLTQNSSTTYSNVYFMWFFHFKNDDYNTFNHKIYTSLQQPMFTYKSTIFIVYLFPKFFWGLDMFRESFSRQFKKKKNKCTHRSYNINQFIIFCQKGRLIFFTPKKGDFCMSSFLDALACLRLV